MKLRNYLINIFFILLAIPVFGQKVTITGKISDATTSEELIGAKITVNDGEAVTGTNADGRFSIDLKEGTTSAKIKITFITYKDQEFTMSNLKPGNNEKNISMDPEGSSTEETVITDSKYEKKIEDISISISMLKPKNIDAQASTDLLKAMEQTSGVTIMKDQPNIRGSAGYTYGSGTRVLTMLDGLPMISADRSGTNFDMLPTDNIKQVEVIKGASSVLFGAGAMGGVINVLTSDPTTTPKTSIRIRHEVYGNPGIKGANWDNRSSAYNTSMHMFHARKIKNFDLTTQMDLINSTGYKQEEFIKRGRFLLMTKYYFPKVQGLTIGLNGQVSIDSSASFLAWRGYPDSLWIAGNGFLSYQFLQRYTVDPHAAYMFKNGNRIVYKGRLFYQDNKINTGQSGSAALIYNELQYIHNIVKPKSDTSGIRLIGIIGVNAISSRVKALATFGKASGDQYAAFGQLDLKWGRLNLSVGGRYQYETMEGDKFNFILLPPPNGGLDSVERIGREKKVTMNEPIGRLGANFRVHRATFLRASFGQGLRSPSVAERYTTTSAGGITVIPSTNVRVERGYTMELGVKQLFKFGNSVKGFIDLSAFNMEFHDMVEFLIDRNADFFSGSIAFSAQNVNNASIKGAEANWYADIKANNWIFSLGGGLTYINPVNKNGIKEVTYKSEISGNDTTIKYDGNDDPTPIILKGRYSGNPDSTNIVNDQTYTLKYRSKVVFRSSVEVAYKQYSLMCNYRYNSHMVNVDKIFLLAISGAKEFRENYKGSSVFDFIFSANIRKNTVSFHVFNAFNQVYAMIPGSIGAQRSFALQYKWVF